MGKQVFVWQEELLKVTFSFLKAKIKKRSQGRIINCFAFHVFLNFKNYFLKHFFVYKENKTP